MQSAMRLHLRARATRARLHHGLISPSRSFGTTPRRQDYASTLSHLRIGSKTRVIFQGFTGRQATVNAQESIEWGTNIVGGVTPNRTEEHLGLPVLPTVREAVEQLKPDATAIYVPAVQAPAAIEAAIEAEVPLIVAVAEHVALHDMLRIRQVLQTQSRSRLVGPNSPGIISATEGERCRIGFQPLPCFSAGCVGIASRSGTLSYEAVASTTRAGLGQSLVIGVGGDVLPGTDLVEALQVLEADPATKAIALIGEVGGDGEVLAAQWIRDYHARTPEPQRKPILGLVAGRFSPSDRVMGHAGAFWVPGEPTAEQKVQAFNAIGVPTVNHPSKMGDALKTMLQDAANRAALPDQTPKQSEVSELVDGDEYASPDSFADAVLGNDPQHQQQTRGLHTLARGLLNRSRPTVSSSLRPIQQRQVRSMHLDRKQCIEMIVNQGLGTGLQLKQGPLLYLGISIDRSTATQCIISGRVLYPGGWTQPRYFHKTLLPLGTTDILTLGQQQQDAVVTTLYRHLQIDRPPFVLTKINHFHALKNILITMAKLFKGREAAFVSVHLGPSLSTKNPFYPYDMRIELDDGVGQPGGRMARQHAALSKMAARAQGSDGDRPGPEAEAAAHGIVYHRLQPHDYGYDIGTVVNGAGLAMNTIDALHDMGGLAANFLDTGGKATADTVRRSFEVVLRDPRVRVVLVNIFGGLTRGDVIARGVVEAYEAMRAARAEMPPVVVRIRGTNEAEGQAIIAQSGLPLHAFDDFDEAAAKAIELAQESRARQKAAKKAEAEAEAARTAGVEGTVERLEKQEASTEEQEASTEKQEVSTENQEVSTEKLEASTEKKEASTEKQEDVIKTDT